MKRIILAANESNSCLVLSVTLEISQAISHREREVGVASESRRYSRLLHSSNSHRVQNFVHWSGRRRRGEWRRRRGKGPEKKAIDGGGILKTRNWRNDEFAEGRGEEVVAVHSFTIVGLCKGNYLKEEGREESA